MGGSIPTTLIVKKLNPKLETHAVTGNTTS